MFEGVVVKKYVIKCAFYAALANDVFKEEAGAEAASVFSNEGMAGGLRAVDSDTVKREGLGNTSDKCQ